MLGYGFPIAILAGLFVGVLLAFNQPWLGLALCLATAPFLPFGGLRASPPVVRLWSALRHRASKRRRQGGWKRHRYR